MPRLKTLRISAINLTVNPHPDGTYPSLLREIFKSRSRVSVHGSDHLMIGELRQLERGDDSILTGSFYKFLVVDTTTPWINSETNEYATPDDMETIELPGNLLPNSAMFNFIFYTREHILFFEKDANKKKLSPLQVARFLEVATQTHRIQSNYGDITITIIPEKETINRILSLPTLKTITIDLKKPNPDDLASISARFMERLESQKAKRWNQSLHADTGESLSLDSDTINVAKVAARNGHVEGKGINQNGTRTTISTKDHPMEIKQEYNPNNHTPMTALREATDSFNAQNE